MASKNKVQLSSAMVSALSKAERSDKLDEKDRATLHSLRQWIATQLPAKRASITDTTQEEPAEVDAVDSSFIEAFKATSFASSRQNSALPMSKLASFSSRGGSVSITPLERINSSTASLAKLADPEVQQLVAPSQIGKWGFDIDALDTATNGRPLAALAISGMKALNLIESCNLQEDKVLHWALDVERQYLMNPFHDHRHAADVLQTVLSILMQDLKDSLEPAEQLTLLLAAAMHDIGHPGLNNDFLEATLAEPAVTYSGQSPNEMMHAATATKTLLREENNFLVPPATVALRDIRAGLIQAILGTDLKFHNEVQRKYGAALEKFGPNLATWPSSSDPAVAAARRDVLTFVMHVADVSNVLKPRDMAISWAKRFLAECQEQGDKEVTLGLPTNSLTVRPGNLPHSQKVFILIFGRPSAAALARVAPAAGGAALANCEANLAYWQGLMDEGVTAL